MKQTIFGLLLVFVSFAALAENIRPIRSATLRACDRGMMGCRAHIEFEGQSIQLNVGSLPTGVFSVDGDDVSVRNIEGFVRSEEQHPGTFRDEFFLVSSDNAAELSFCNERLMGCAARITINGEEVILDRSTVSDSVNRRLNPAGAGGSITASVKGYFAHEKGHFPNPMAYFRVFKVLEISFPDSEVIDNSERWYWDSSPSSEPTGTAPNAAIN